MSTYESVRHAKGDGKYPLVFVPKGRKNARYGKVRKFLGPVLHAWASQRRSQMLEGHMVQAHVHMQLRMPLQYAVAAVVGSRQGKAAIAVVRPCGGRTRNGNGAACWARGYAGSTVGCAEEQLRRYIRHQEQCETQGEDADGACPTSFCSFTWQPLGLLTTVKPPALRERHESTN